MHLQVSITNYLVIVTQAAKVPTMADLSVCNIIISSYVLVSLLVNIPFLVKTSSLPPQTCIRRPKNITGGVGAKRVLELVDPYGPCSHSGVAKQISPQEILRRGDARAKSLLYRFSADAKVHGKYMELPVFALEEGYRFSVEIGFGTPVRTMTLLLDTASDLTWIQCQPCQICYNQTDELFDPSSSSSYSAIGCNTYDCSLLEKTTGMSQQCDLLGRCAYRITYIDNAYVNGLFSYETLTFGGNDVLEEILFGCGNNQNGDYGKEAGILGLGISRIGFMSQTVQKYGKTFSYCIPSPETVGYFKLGLDQEIGPLVQFIPFIPNSDYPYLVTITSVLLDNEKIDMQPWGFLNSQIIVDSGTSVTQLPKSAYFKLRAAFRKAMKSYRRAPSINSLDTCYSEFPSNSEDLPHLTFVFNSDIRIEMHSQGALYKLNSTYACFPLAALRGDEEPALLGTLHQQGLEVVFDIPNGQVGFGPGDCD